MSKLDLTKPVQCRGGYAFELLRPDVKDSQPIVGVVKFHDGTEAVHQWYEDGRFLSDKESCFDLINVPEKKTIFTVIYENGSGFITNYHGAWPYRDNPEVSVVRTEYTVGQKDL